MKLMKIKPLTADESMGGESEGVTFNPHQDAIGSSNKLVSDGAGEC